MRTFEAFGGFYDDGRVFVREEGRAAVPLNPHLEVMNKSPTGFAWGYWGSGPAQLAFALLAAVIGVERAQDPRMFQKYKQEVVGALDQKQGWVITEAEIKAWVDAQENEAQRQREADRIDGYDRDDLGESPDF